MRVFIDSSVIIAALLSPTGASTVILLFCEMQMITGYISQDVAREIKIVLERKFPEKKKQFEKLLWETNLKLIHAKNKKLFFKAKKWIKDPHDVHILVAAKEAKVDYLITLDIRDFIKDTAVSEKSGLKICTPGDFLHILRTTL